MSQLSKLDTNEYCISCYKEKIENNHLEIQYLKQDSFIKKLLSPFSYLYLILKSNPLQRDLQAAAWADAPRHRNGSKWT